MAYYNKRVIRHQVLSISFDSGVDTAGMEPLELLGIRGQIRRVCVREVEGNTTGSLDVWIVDEKGSQLPTPPKDEDVFYSNLGTAITSSPTTAMINDHVAATGGSDYEVAPRDADPDAVANLQFMWEVTPVLTGDTVFAVTVWSEVQL